MKKIANLSDIKVGKIQSFDFDGEEVIIINTGDEIIALSGICPHADAPMVEGLLNQKKTTIECPWHNSIFDLTSGDILEGPSYEGLTKFDVEIRDEEIFIGLNPLWMKLYMQKIFQKVMRTR